jgi:DNA-binding NtrC family response regulator
VSATLPPTSAPQGPRRVLLVDDDLDLCKTLEVGLSRRDFQVSFRTSEREALALLDAEDFDVVLTDLTMKEIGGIELCRAVLERRSDIPVVVLTAFGSFDAAFGAIRAGAYDFISKPVQLDVLAVALGRAASHRALREEVKRLRSEASNHARFEALLGSSPAMNEVKDRLERIKDSEATVIITGESGTGKEVVARLLHAGSRRHAGPFVGINCAAMPEPLLESELFGHVRGAFTDAKEARPGLFAQAKHGTLFLDEVGDMPLGLQPKLLRVLQERTVRPVGGNSEVPTDVRVVAATNRDLESMVEAKRFREDLYFRLNVIHLPLPPLRARVGDILPLAQRFLTTVATRDRKNITGIAPEAASRLVHYPWPGNVRELQNCIEHGVALARYDLMSVDDLPDKIREYRSSHILLAADNPSELVPMEEVEHRYILRVLEAVQGNKTAAARILGIERKTLYRKLERFGIDVEADDVKAKR